MRGPNWNVIDDLMGGASQAGGRSLLRSGANLLALHHSPVLQAGAVGIAGMAYHAARTAPEVAAGVGHWALGGDWRLVQKHMPSMVQQARGKTGEWIFNPSLRSKIIGVTAGIVAVNTIREFHRARTASIYTTDERLEQRARRDLGATGSLALALSQSDNRDTLVRALPHLL